MTIAQTILETLRTWHRQQAGELLRRLGVSRPSLMRAIAELDGQVISRGRARRTAYAARRAIRGNPNPLPLYRIDALGRAHEAGLLEPVYPEGCALSFTETCPWPLDDEMTDGWFRSLPYFLATCGRKVFSDATSRTNSLPSCKWIRMCNAGTKMMYCMH